MKKRLTAMLVALAVCASASFNVVAVTSSNTAPTSPLSAEIHEIKLDDYSLEISMNKKKVQLASGENLKLKAKTNFDGYTPTFYSTNKKVAKVTKNGQVKTLAQGKAKIVAECNGVKTVCKVNVNKPMGNQIADSTMATIAAKIGCQTQYAYPSSTIMCSAYSFAYAYYQVTGVYKTPGSLWYAGGCTWAGGTDRYYSSASAMLQAIKNEIDKNKACVGLLSTRAGEHYVTFYSYTGDGTTLSDFTVVDPWDGQIKNASQFGYYRYHVVTVNG